MIIYRYIHCGIDVLFLWEKWIVFIHSLHFQMPSLKITSSIFSHPLRFLLNRIGLSRKIVWKPAGDPHIRRLMWFLFSGMQSPNTSPAVLNFSTQRKEAAVLHKLFCLQWLEANYKKPHALRYWCTYRRKWMPTTLRQQLLWFNFCVYWSGSLHRHLLQLPLSLRSVTAPKKVSCATTRLVQNHISLPVHVSHSQSGCWPVSWFLLTPCLISDIVVMLSLFFPQLLWGEIYWCL